jgi:L-ribulose-5-phosphate 3-epimerase
MAGCWETEMSVVRRRDFIIAGLGARALFAKQRIDRGRVSAITDEIAKSPSGAIAFIKQYGLKWVELRGVPGRGGTYAFLPEPELRAAAKELADHGIRVSFLNTPLLKFSLPGTNPIRRRPESGEERAVRIARDAERFERRMDDLKNAIRAAQIFGVDKIRVFTFHRVEEPRKLLPRIAGLLSEMAEAAGKEGVHLLVENEGSCNVASCAELAALMEMLPSRWIGINWDALNGTSQKETPFPDGYGLLPKERVGNVQIKGRSVLDGSQRLDWAAILRALENDGYHGCVGLETHIFGETQIQASHDSMREILRIVEAS